MSTGTNGSAAKHLEEAAGMTNGFRTNGSAHGPTQPRVEWAGSGVGADYPIQTNALTKRFPRAAGWKSILKKTEGKLALDSVDLTVRQGEIFGLLGPNGAGKTTIMKILSGLLVPSNGTAAVAGFDVVHESVEVRKRIGLVHGDERTFFWRLSVRENLRFYAHLYSVPRQDAEARIEQLLDLVGLTPAADTRMDRFSTGMKQRAAIARGLLNDPDILLMDEPTRTLDPVASREIRRFIRSQVTGGGRRTVLLATNLMAEAEELCDRLAMMNHGRICFAGTIDELRQTIQVEQMHSMSVSGIDPERLRRAATLPEVISLDLRPAPDGRYEIDLGVSRESTVVPEVIARIVGEGGRIWFSRPRDLSLEELFHTAIGADIARRARQPEGAAS